MFPVDIISPLLTEKACSAAVVTLIVGAENERCRDL